MIGKLMSWINGECVGVVICEDNTQYLGRGGCIGLAVIKGVGKTVERPCNNDAMRTTRNTHCFYANAIEVVEDEED